nr:hypothetical protein [uncultured Cupriavidus sp.]
MKAVDQRITPTELAKAAGYANYSAANLQYGLLGALLFAKMPSELQKGNNGAPVMTHAIASQEDLRASSMDEWIWQTRPYIAAGLVVADIL